MPDASRMQPHRCRGSRKLNPMREFTHAVLVLLSGWMHAHWNPPMLACGVPHAGIGISLFGAVSVFMAYEGFQLES